MENLARYIIRASFSQERMTYFHQDSKVVYRGRTAKRKKSLMTPTYIPEEPQNRNTA